MNELPEPVFDLTLSQECQLRQIELELEGVPEKYADVIYSLAKQNMILRNNISNLTKGYLHGPNR